MENSLSVAINSLLPPDIVRFLAGAAAAAASQGARLYLVGGTVRDLLLGQGSRDIDLLLDGDAISLAGALVNSQPGKLRVHRRFGTAKISYANFSVDLTAQRDETYAHPGALPDVRPGTLASDLKRRDFTINAIAVSLMAPDFGEVTDLYNGRADINAGVIRLLHEKSFVDDATRIWRAVRYRERLDFKLAPETLARLHDDLPMLATVSPERIRYELECVFAETAPEKTLAGAAALGVLPSLHPRLGSSEVLEPRFRAARDACVPKTPSFELYLALLAYDLPETTQLGARLRLSKRSARVLADVQSVKSDLGALAAAGDTPSRVYRLLHGLDLTALTAASLAAAGDAATGIRNYLQVYRYVKPSLDGHALMALGVPPGPKLLHFTEKLRAALLDGRAGTAAEETALVKKLIRGI